MKRMRGFLFTIPGLALGVVAATTTEGVAIAQDPEAICGPCGVVAKGDVSISGDARLDGFFQAVGSLQGATATITGDFEANILALADVYGVGSGEFSADLVGDVIAAIQADIAANVEGGLTVNYEPPQCSANISVAVDAQAKCEASAECEVEANPGSVSVQCEGSCSGGCSGSCSGEASCVVTAPTLNCEGTCEGTCELSAAASCEGKCNGTCNGNCSATAADGSCAGSCDGTCEGSCELSGGASCTGTCHGKCKVEQGSAQCTGEVQCEGSCDAECSGGCQGSATPPSASANCEASADCNAQASAQADASLTCTPPSLELSFSFGAGVDASAQAAFTARLGELKARGAAIVKGAAQLSALVTGEIEGEVVFNPAPLARLQGSLEGLASASAIADFDIAVGRLPCVVPAFTAAISGLGSVVSETGATISAQAEFVGFITTGS